MRTRTIKQTVTISAAPHVVYEMLMDSRKHSKLTGAPAKVSRKIGGAFTVYDGYAFGKNIELEPDARIVQTWSASDWPEGSVSTISITLISVAAGCRITFVHSGLPAEHADSIKQGWIDFLMVPHERNVEKKLNFGLSHLFLVDNLLNSSEFLQL